MTMKNVFRHRFGKKEREEVPLENTTIASGELTNDELAHVSGGKSSPQDFNFVKKLDKASATLAMFL